MQQTCYLQGIDAAWALAVRTRERDANLTVSEAGALDGGKISLFRSEGRGRSAIGRSAEAELAREPA